MMYIGKDLLRESYLSNVILEFQETSFISADCGYLRKKLHYIVIHSLSQTVKLRAHPFFRYLTFILNIIR